MAINLYETRMMLQAIERSLPAQTFLRDTFFPSIQTFVTEKVDVDIKRASAKWRHLWLIGVAELP